MFSKKNMLGRFDCAHKDNSLAVRILREYFSDKIAEAASGSGTVEERLEKLINAMRHCNPLDELDDTIENGAKKSRKDLCDFNTALIGYLQMNVDKDDNAFNRLFVSDEGKTAIVEKEAPLDNPFSAKGYVLKVFVLS